MGKVGAARTMTRSLDKKRSCSTMECSKMHSTGLTIGMRPPLSPCPSSSLETPASLQCNVEDDVSDGGNAPVGAMYRGQGRQLGGRAIWSAVVYDVAVGGGGGGGGRATGGRTVKATNYKRWGWAGHQT